MHAGPPDLVGSVSAWKPDHCPTDHVRIPAITRISEEAFDGLPHQCARTPPRNSIQILPPASSFAQIAILLVRALAKGVPDAGELLVDCADRFLKSSAGVNGNW